MKYNEGKLIFKIDNQFDWMKTHAQVPTVLVKKNLIRIYFATRPKPNLSLTTFVDLGINDFSKEIFLNPKPILELGTAGTFDEHGIMPSSVIEKDGIVYLYYSGWQQSVTVPYNNYTGLAISEDGGKTFRKFAKGPIIDRTPFELYSATSPCVFFEDNIWHMFYCSGTNWYKINNKYEHTYDIKYASSKNGIDWNQSNKTVITQKNKFEAITRPSIIKINNRYYMLFCYRGSSDFRDGKESYSIGLAKSNDLLNWIREDNNVIIKSHNLKWDYKMQAYPEIVKIRNKIHLFYNGNNFGKAGFGYLILDEI